MDLILNGGHPEEEPKQLVLIKYPGIIKNLDAALKTMGGLQQISSNHFNNHSLELSHTPDNPYTSRIMSERKNEDNVSSGTLHLVMTVKRKKKKKNVVKVEFLGLVNSVYTFDVMCDFQYLPLKKRAGSDHFDDLIPKLIPTDMSSALCWWEKNEVTPTPLFLPPYQFSRYLHPSTKILAKETDFSVEKTKRANKFGFGQNLRVERKALSITVQANEEFPSEPQSEAIEDADFRCKHEEPHRLVRELFEERPMWTRTAVLYRTGLEDSLLRSLLQKYAFYIQSGPWGRLWCRFGYDPRKMTEAGVYQTLMVSFRQHGRIPERQRLKVSNDRSQQFVDNSQIPINYVYEEGELPRVRQMWYSLIDVHIQQARTLIETTPMIEPSYVAMNGWIPAHVVDQIRDIIKADVRRTSNDIEVQMNETVGEEEF